MTKKRELIYVVFERERYEGERVLSVHASMEGAEAALKSLRGKNDDGWITYHVDTHQLKE